MIPGKEKDLHGKEFLIRIKNSILGAGAEETSIISFLAFLGEMITLEILLGFKLSDGGLLEIKSKKDLSPIVVGLSVVVVVVVVT